MPELDERFLTTADALPEGDYVSPGLAVVRLDACFPNLVTGDKLNHPWRYLRREIPHTWYIDKREPLMGFLDRDEAILLYNIARSFKGKRALEIGCWFGWSTCHLALGGVELDVIDPALANPLHLESITHALQCCGVQNAVRLYAGKSPDEVAKVATQHGGLWSLFFVDGDHEQPAPERDVEECLKFAAPDAAFIFHDVASPDVAAALRLLEARGFNILLYQTMQIMAFAWRGNITPVQHIPDPLVPWQLPHHLVGFPVSGAEFPGYPASLRMKAISQDLELQAKAVTIERLNTDLRDKAHLIEQHTAALDQQEQQIRQLREELSQRAWLLRKGYRTIRRLFSAER